MRSSLLLTLVFLIVNLAAYAQEVMQFEDSRDKEIYNYVLVDKLFWMTDNLRFSTEEAYQIKEDDKCAYFYGVEEAFKVCPEGWRLPNEKEVKKLLKLDKRGVLDVADSLKILKCGRIDNYHHSKFGEQNTFWMDAELIEGSITHWHLFHDGHEIHHHNVVVAERMFPVRCVKEP